jgi:hypothetical protein
LQMAKKDVRFEKIDARLAQAKSHGNAKTSGETEHMRAETALLVQEYGGSRIAHRMVSSLADDLAEAREELNRLRNDRAFRALKWIKDMAKTIIGRE